VHREIGNAEEMSLREKEMREETNKKFKVLARIEDFNG
jgi:hypothetical protein